MNKLKHNNYIPNEMMKTNGITNHIQIEFSPQRWVTAQSENQPKIQEIR